MRGRASKLGSAAILALMSGGCGANLDTLVATGSLGLASNASVHAESPVEIYSRVARGALACWFGPNGSLKKTLVFHADVAPEPKGGTAEIVLHQRDAAAESPRSLRAYRIVIERTGEGSRMVSENMRLPEAVARDMQADLGRWATGQTGCATVGTGGWNAAPAPPAEVAPPPAAKPKAGKAKASG
jgi:hypothetical protein